jgi:ketosteroid isomerase-like protein
MMPHSELLTNTYRAFNARDIDAVLEVMHTDVDWPNGMEGGRVQGHQEVRDYWTRQWRLIDPRVEPVGFTTDEAGRTVVDVHAIIRDLAGNVIKDERLKHVYVIKDGLIMSMEIRKP